MTSSAAPGIEATFEKELRGTYGTELKERDAQGRPLKTIRTLQEPEPGKNLMLTIDARMQRIATQSLEWGMRAAGLQQGVTIVMNPQTGEILAMVSLPAYDNNKFAAGISADDYAVYLSDPAKPLRNHAIADIYPPGSTFKLVTGPGRAGRGRDHGRPRRGRRTAATRSRTRRRASACSTGTTPVSGPLNMTQAYAISSDTFFYQMAVGLGVDRLGEWANRMGFGEKSGIRLPGEADGIIASTGVGALPGPRGRLHRRAGAGRHRAERGGGHAAAAAQRLCHAGQRWAPDASR